MKQIKINRDIFRETLNLVDNNTSDFVFGTTTNVIYCELDSVLTPMRIINTITKEQITKQ